MPEGYLSAGGRPDVAWWLEQIHKGEEYRKKVACQERWPVWREYIRGDWRGDVLPVNKTHSILRQMVPRVYFRNPAVSVMPAQGGFLNMAFAQLLGRIDNKLLRQMKVKKAIKAQVRDAFAFGTGLGKLGYGGLFSPDPSGVGAPVGGGGEAFEYSTGVVSGHPWYKRVKPDSIVTPDGLDDFEESRWLAHKVTRPVDDVRRDPRFKNTKGLRGSFASGTSPSMPHEKERAVEEVELYEIRDRKFGRVIVLAPNQDSGIVIYDNEDALSTRRLPIFDIVFNDDDEYCWGISDIKILEPSQLELNEIRTLAMKHRRIAMAKLLYKKGAITPAQLSNLLSEDVGAGVEIVTDLTDVKFDQNTQIPTDLIPHEGQVEHSVREAVGFSRNQLGEFQTRRGDTSAFEAAKVSEGSEIRVDERRDIVADMVTEIVKEMNEIIFDNWTVEQVVEVTGPGGMPIWVQVNPSMLRSGSYSIRIDPDSAQTRTRQQREAKAVGVYNLLKQNPLIDPLKLTQYLITEIEGVEFDDIMRMMPPVTNGQAGGVLNPGQFAGLLANGARELAANPGALRGSEG